MPNKNIENLNLQENALAFSMLHRVGDAAISFSITPDGTRQHQTPWLADGELDKLTHDFAKDPKESLAWARESLFNIYFDERLRKSERSRRLSRYLEAYNSLNLKLDHSAFPATERGKVFSGVPDYIPDGFVDMGGEGTLNPNLRMREQMIL